MHQILETKSDLKKKKVKIPNYKKKKTITVQIINIKGRSGFIFAFFFSYRIFQI